MGITTLRIRLVEEVVCEEKLKRREYGDFGESEVEGGME
jgi:hypothetical protein